jgi:amino acid permease
LLWSQLIGILEQLNKLLFGELDYLLGLVRVLVVTICVLITLFVIGRLVLIHDLAFA